MSGILKFMHDFDAWMNRRVPGCERQFSKQEHARFLAANFMLVGLAITGLFGLVKLIF